MPLEIKVKSGSGTFFRVKRNCSTGAFHHFFDHGQAKASS
jgi:hypothetical protein